MASDVYRHRFIRYGTVLHCCAFLDVVLSVVGDSHPDIYMDKSGTGIGQYIQLAVFATVVTEVAISTQTVREV